VLKAKVLVKCRSLCDSQGKSVELERKDLVSMKEHKVGDWHGKLQKISLHPTAEFLQ
jgi:hypothetical protein